MSKRFVSSDLHFYHANILQYCNRPFASVEEMNKQLIANWNKVVSKDDIVYVLGDFCFGNRETIINITSKLKGRKILVYGNHDHTSKTVFRDAGFEEVCDYHLVIGKNFILSHRPLELNLGDFYNIHGHKHRLPHEEEVSQRHFDIGVDANNFTPVLLDDVMNELLKRNN